MTATQTTSVSTPAEDFQKYAEELVRTFKVPGLSIAVVKVGAVGRSSVVFHNFGKRHEETRTGYPSELADENTLYYIASEMNER